MGRRRGLKRPKASYDSSKVEHVEQTSIPSPQLAPLAGQGPRAGEGSQDEMPRMAIRGRYVLLFGLFVLAALGFLYFVLPRIAGLQQTWDRLDDGNAWWIGVGVLFEVLSFTGYVVLFRTVCVPDQRQVGWRESYEIAMAGLAATRLFAAAGAGGIALTAWALRRSGMRRRTVACRMFAFLVLLYGVYMSALVIDGVLLRVGVLSGPAPFAMTVVPAVFGGVVTSIVLAVALVPADFERRLMHWRHGSSRIKQWAQRAATVPATMATGVRTAIRLTRDGELGLIGALAWWAFDIATLWASFRAFGEAPPGGVLVMAYFVGMLANTLPLPGGIGGVEGGMIGAFIALGVSGGLAVVAVLVYRGLAFWLPTIPGAIAYFQLRRTVGRWQTEAQPAHAT